MHSYLLRAAHRWLSVAIQYPVHTDSNDQVISAVYRYLQYCVLLLVMSEDSHDLKGGVM